MWRNNKPTLQLPCDARALPATACASLSRHGAQGVIAGASQSNTNEGLCHWGFSLQKSIPPWAFCLAVGVDQDLEMFGDSRILSTCRRKSTARGTLDSVIHTEY